MPTTIQEEKAHLRRTMLLERDRLSPDLRRQMSRQITASLCTMTFWSAASSILLYASVRGEVDTHGLITDSLKRPASVILPRVDKNAAKLLLYRILSWNDLAPGPFGIPEPRDGQCTLISPDTIDCAVIPGIVFDMTGARIGYGKGYYDRLLAELNAPTAGLCFEHQLVGHIPCESHDRRVHMIITEKRIIYCDGYQKD